MNKLHIFSRLCASPTNFRANIVKIYLHYTFKISNVQTNSQEYKQFNNIINSYNAKDSHSEL